jgi:phage terminase large subunit-like protein
MGRKALSIQELDARGSPVANEKRKALRPKRRNPKVAPVLQSNIDYKEIIDRIPGYNPADSDYVYDEVAARKAVEFFPNRLRHIEGSLYGQRFELQAWEQAIVANLFGWKKKDGTRRYREAFIFVPRKSGKTPLVAGINLYILFEEDEFGQQNFLAAADSEQASLVFRWMWGMIEFDDEMMSRCKIFGKNATNQTRTILMPETGSFVKVLSSDASTKHGGNSHLITVDELHAIRGRELVDVLTTSMASKNRKQPLILYITTSDYDRPSICNEKYEYACKVRDGIVKNPEFLPVIYEAPKDSDWTRPETWKIANPNYGISVDEDYLLRECKRAQDEPAFENTFKRLHLNIKTEQAVRWIKMEDWDACGMFFEPNLLAGQPCWGGLDLSSKIDTTSFSLFFKPAGIDDFWKWMTWFWVPAETIEMRSKRERLPYDLWWKQGFIEQVAGKVVDYSFIRAKINELNKIYKIQDIGYDPYNATHLAQELKEQDGFNMVEFRQGFASMNEPTKELEKLIISQKISHNKHPVLRWMASNVSAVLDPAGNIKMDKAKSTERIDGMVSGVMALGRAIVSEARVSVYESRGVLTA